MLNSQSFCIKFDSLGLFIITEVLLSVLGRRNKGVEVTSYKETIFFLLTVFSIMWSRHWFDINYIPLSAVCCFNIQTNPICIFVRTWITTGFSWEWFKFQSILNRYLVQRSYWEDFLSAIILWKYWSQICMEVFTFQCLFWKQLPK